MDRYLTPLPPACDHFSVSRQKNRKGRVTMLRSRGAASIATALVLGQLCLPAAGQKTLVVAGYGGSWETVLRKDVFPAFEAKHGVKIEYTPATRPTRWPSCRRRRATR